jgi:transposase InsO family protein
VGQEIQEPEIGLAFRYGYGIREGFSKPVEHHKYAGLTARKQNNKVERFHNTFRERDKVMRGFKSPRTAGIMAEGFRTYYNFIRPHAALGGLTPAQRAGINLNLGTNPTLQLLMISNFK